jgi:peptidoglycan biosynthesis protein MviN/MurJ (putative lipid II flippase)
VVDLLIVLASVQTSFIRTDSYVIDATLQPKLRVTFGAVAAVMTIALSWALCRAFGMPGLCAGVLLGRLVQTVAYPMMVRRSLSEASRVGLSLSLRKASLTLSLFAVAAVIGERTAVSSWIGFGTGVLVSLAILFMLAVLIGSTGTERTALAGRLRTLRVEAKRP